ncbi:hypothetical protein PTTG_10824 [Puccinia triticina 1-1 BBBD Race 1]|uniref:Uncharacterized protein n=1 Tax=Puccinia triticina (isolate 1-1 / race 1 (BBBD)) TaxID=630390 RepID=A0A0C4FC72_PUCT1|nr:hypothetical protein PTTG_10824 [Puccinia triticina 1-1 BBBD Race 1]
MHSLNRGWLPAANVPAKTTGPISETPDLSPLLDGHTGPPNQCPKLPDSLNGHTGPPRRSHDPPRPSQPLALVVTLLVALQRLYCLADKLRDPPMACRTRQWLHGPADGFLDPPIASWTRRWLHGPADGCLDLSTNSLPFPMTSLTSYLPRPSKSPPPFLFHLHHTEHQRPTEH